MPDELRAGSGYVVEAESGKIRSLQPVKFVEDIFSVGEATLIVVCAGNDAELEKLFAVTTQSVERGEIDRDTCSNRWSVTYDNRLEWKLCDYILSDL